MSERWSACLLCRRLRTHRFERGPLDDGVVMGRMESIDLAFRTYTHTHTSIHSNSRTGAVVPWRLASHGAGSRRSSSSIRIITSVQRPARAGRGLQARRRGGPARRVYARGGGGGAARDGRDAAEAWGGACARVRPLLLEYPSIHLPEYNNICACVWMCGLFWHKFCLARRALRLTPSSLADFQRASSGRCSTSIDPSFQLPPPHNRT